MPMNRTHMRRQLYKGGGIASLYPREKFGAGSWLKKKIRNLIPNELADVAVKAAPFVAPFFPGYAAAMRGIGRFDQRGSMSDAMKQAALTYAGGKGARYLGGADKSFSLMPGQGTTGGPSTYNLSNSPISRTWDRMMPKGETQGRDLTKSIKGNQSGPWDTGKWGPTPGAEGTGQNWISDTWNAFKGMNPNMQSAIAGGVSGAISYFTSQYPPQQPGEDTAAYMEKRRKSVGKLMLQYMDNTRAHDPEWLAMTDEQKSDYINRVNKNQGGRIGYQTGGITMANTLAQNIAQNRANQQAVGGMFEAARSRLPGYVAPQRAMAPTPAPILPRLPPITLPVQPPERPDDVVERVLPMEPPKKIIPRPEEGTIGPITKMPVEPDPNIPIEELIDGPMIDQPYTAVMPDEGNKYVYDPDGTRRQVPLTPEEKYRMENPDENATLMPIEEIDQIDMTKPPNTPIGMKDSPLTVMPRYNDPLPQDQLMAGFEEWKRNNPVGGGTAAIVPATLPGGYEHNFSGSGEANAFKRYLESIGQAPYQKRVDENMIAKLNQGGRVGQMYGTGPQGLPGIPRQAPDGMEFDMRMNGGFQGLGKKEGKDDIPAMLAKNEFVFTADAVRGAGGGDIELGAQRMYDTMKNLEKRMA